MPHLLSKFHPTNQNLSLQCIAGGEKDVHSKSTLLTITKLCPRQRENERKSISRALLLENGPPTENGMPSLGMDRSFSMTGKQGRRNGATKSRTCLSIGLDGHAMENRSRAESERNRFEFLGCPTRD